MWVDYNANPAGNRRIDCTVRALSAATGQEWLDTYWELCQIGADNYLMPSDNIVWRKFLRRHGFRRYPIDKGDDYTVRDFCWDNPDGLYVLAISGHVVVVLNGNYFDFWDSGEEIPLYVWRRE